MNENDKINANLFLFNWLSYATIKILQKYEQKQWNWWVENHWKCLIIKKPMDKKTIDDKKCSIDDTINWLI